MARPFFARQRRRRRQGAPQGQDKEQWIIVYPGEGPSIFVRYPWSPLYEPLGMRCGGRRHVCASRVEAPVPISPEARGIAIGEGGAEIDLGEALRLAADAAYYMESGGASGSATWELPSGRLALKVEAPVPFQRRAYLLIDNIPVIGVEVERTWVEAYSAEKKKPVVEDLPAPVTVNIYGLEGLRDTLLIPWDLPPAKYDVFLEHLDVLEEAPVIDLEEIRTTIPVAAARVRETAPVYVSAHSPRLAGSAAPLSLSSRPGEEHLVVEAYTSAPGVLEARGDLLLYESSGPLGAFTLEAAELAGTAIFDLVGVVVEPSPEGYPSISVSEILVPFAPTMLVRRGFKIEMWLKRRDVTIEGSLAEKIINDLVEVLGILGSRTEVL